MPRISSSRARRRSGHIDIMVDDAARQPAACHQYLTEDDWEKGLQLKFMGYVRCLRYVLPIMVKQGGRTMVRI